MKSSTLKLSHVSKFEPKFALVADFLVFEDRHFTGKIYVYAYYCRTYEKAVSGGEREGKRRTCAKGHH